MDAFDATIRRGGDGALREASRFFVQADAVYDSLREIARRFPEIGVSYAVLGGMALVAHGYRRTTEDVDVLVTPEGLRRIHEKLVGLGYRPAFEKSRNLRDTRTGVQIELVTAGGYPGDGQPKPVVFPDPDRVAVEIDGIRYVNLPTLIELKLASGMTHPGRLRDLADVQELIRVLNLTDDFAEKLNPFVRERFGELLQAVRFDPTDDESNA